MKTAVLVMAYGGPDSLADIEPYLLDVRGGRPVSPEFLAEVTQRYARIGGRSPLLELTRAQAEGLEESLNDLSPSPYPSPDTGGGEKAVTPAQKPGASHDTSPDTGGGKKAVTPAQEPGASHGPSPDTGGVGKSLTPMQKPGASPGQDGVPAFRVYVGMRHWKPYILEAVEQIAADGFQNVVAFCMTPHASTMSTGAYLKKLHDAVAASPRPLSVNFIESWYDRPFLVEALAGKVRQAVLQFSAEDRPKVHYLFTAHSLPASIVAQGDPYPEQLQATARLLAAALGLTPEQWSFGYQSAGAAPGAWLGPSIEDILPGMASQGIKNILVTPVGFIADHVEILYDLDIEAQEIAARESIHLVRSESLNASPDFIEGLAKFILERMTTQNYAAV